MGVSKTRGFSRTGEAKVTNRVPILRDEHVFPIKQKSLSFQIGFSKKGDEPSPKGEHVVPIKKRTPTFSGWGSTKKGDDILSHITAVPSAQAGLTSLFGMGRGEPRRNNHLKAICLRS